MIKVSDIKRGSIREICITGHASGKPGENIICAGASMLAYTMAEALLNADTDVKIVDDGDTFKFKVKENPKSKHVISTIMTGYKLLQDNYPKEVSLTENHGCP